MVPYWLILASTTVQNPAYSGKSDSLKLLKSPANASHSVGMGVRSFPLVKIANCSGLTHFSTKVIPLIIIIIIKICCSVVNGVVR